MQMDRWKWSQSEPLKGRPRSPLLSNNLLTDLDKELERRGHSFVRYADDCNVYVQSKASRERVLRSLTNFLEKSLKLRVNASKSAVDRPWKRMFLGHSINLVLSHYWTGYVELGLLKRTAVYGTVRPVV